MGEYARFNRREVKIGTCESMYYLRASQRFMVSHLPGNVDPAGKDALAIRFRFPWPDEDGIEPGAFKDHNRSVAVAVPMPEGVEHYTVQFHAQAGYLCSMPCPEGPGPHAHKIHRNGFAGAVRLSQQKLLADGRLVPVCECGGCGAAWRLEEPAEIEALAQAFVEEGNRQRLEFFHAIAARILEGARLTQPAIAS